MSFSRLWKRASWLVKLFADTLSPLRIAWIARLPCGCIMTELTNVQRTKTYVEFSRSPTCRKWKHFTGHECGWPQIEDASKATILHCAASFESAGGIEAVETLQKARNALRPE